MTKLFLIYLKKKKDEQEDEQGEEEEEEDTSLTGATFLKLQYIITFVSGVNKAQLQVPLI
jgi:hypothetical protein